MLILLNVSVVIRAKSCWEDKEGKIKQKCLCKTDLKVSDMPVCNFFLKKNQPP